MYGVFTGMVIYFGYGVWNSKERSTDPVTRRHRKLVRAAMKSTRNDENLRREAEEHRTGMNGGGDKHGAIKHKAPHALSSAFDMAPLL